MPNPSGAPASQEAEDQLTVTLQSAASIDGSGTMASLSGYAGSQIVELNNSGAGTTTVSLEGSFDGVTWYAAAYYQMDNAANAIRAVSAISVTASPFAHAYALLDSYNFIRARMSGSASSPSLTATLHANPV